MKPFLEQSLTEKHALYTKNQAKAEAERCLFCFDPPCVKACPTEIDIPTFIKKIAVGHELAAARTILSANILGESCARACPVEVLCAGSCVYHELKEPPIEIGRLQRFATSFALKEPALKVLGPKKEATGKKVALIGAGPSSMALASMLSLDGHEPHIFEKRKFAGGLNAYGIAGYKFDFISSQKEIDWLLELGMALHLNTEVVAQNAEAGQKLAKDLLSEFDVVFLALGLGDDKKLLSGPGIIGACDLIEKIKTDDSFSLSGIKHAHVVGGGNTAIDAAHQLKLLGVSHTTLLYRQERQNMSAYAHELNAALASGVHLHTDSVVDKVVHEDGLLKGFYLKGKPDFIKTDLLVIAIGQEGPSVEICRALDVALDEKGRVKVDKNFQTTNPKVFSAGDAVSGGQEVVNAVAEAKVALRGMGKLLAPQ